MTQDIIHNSRTLTLYKANINPDIKSYTVLVSDAWDYVEMFLKRSKNHNALFFWRQAKDFFDAYKILPKESKALLAYYTILNATKTLLIVKNILFIDQHGVSGEKINKKSSLVNESVIFKTNGILGSFATYLGETNNNNKYTLKNLLYNLVYIHRPYCLTFTSQQELFLPVENVGFKWNTDNNEAWIGFELQDKNINVKDIAALGSTWRQDQRSKFKNYIRQHQRFRYTPDLAAFETYHRKFRKRFHYIYSPQKLWYIKKDIVNSFTINRNSMTITFGAMHRLSELERYAPDVLSKHFESNHNWLITEFLNISVPQFIDEISCEITGQNFQIPQRRI